MFGLNYSVKCPHCGKEYISDHGITPTYTVKGKEEIGRYCREDCTSCNKPFLSLCEPVARYTTQQNVQESDIILKIEDYNKEDIVPSGCICF